MNNNTPAPNKENSTAVLIPVLSAIALIIACALYIVYKLGQHQLAEKWADYDDCGWS